MSLKPKINLVGEDPYLPKLSKLHKTGAHAYPLQRSVTLLLASPEFDGWIAGKFREKLEPLYLKSFPLSLFPFLSLIFPPKPFGIREESRFGSSHLPHVKPSLVGLDSLSTLSIYFGFSSNGIMPCVHPWPTLELMFE